MQTLISILAATVLFQDIGDKGTLWSSWGDGCVARNGMYYTSIGDHRGTDANSFVYEYDPTTHKLRRVVDVARAIGQKPGSYGHGKIHSGPEQSRFVQVGTSSQRGLTQGRHASRRRRANSRWIPFRDDASGPHVLVPSRRRSGDCRRQRPACGGEF